MRAFVFPEDADPPWSFLGGIKTSSNLPKHQRNFKQTENTSNELKSQSGSQPTTHNINILILSNVLTQETVCNMPTRDPVKLVLQSCGFLRCGDVHSFQSIPQIVHVWRGIERALQCWLGDRGKWAMQDGRLRNIICLIRHYPTTAHGKKETTTLQFSEV